MSDEVGSELPDDDAIIHNGDRHFAFVRDVALSKLDFESVGVDILSEPETEPPVHGQKRADDLARRRTEQEFMPGRGIPARCSRGFRVQNRSPRA